MSKTTNVSQVLVILMALIWYAGCPQEKVLARSVLGTVQAGFLESFPMLGFIMILLLPLITINGCCWIILICTSKWADLPT